MFNNNPNAYPTNERAVRQSNPVAGGMPPTYGTSRASGPAPSTAGHHTHDLLNKLDPRVDSTHDHQPMPAASQPVHSSKLANALDPRVDTRTANATISSGVQQPAMHGAAGLGSSHQRSAPEGTYGPHSSRMGNAMDPRVDSDMDSHGMRSHNAATGTGYGSGMRSHNAAIGAGYGSGTHSAGGMGAGTMRTSHLPGPAPNTAGPHRSDLMNKLDPRVDSKGTGLGGNTAGMGTGATYRGDDVRRGI